MDRNIGTQTLDPPASIGNLTNWPVRPLNHAGPSLFIQATIQFLKKLYITLYLKPVMADIQRMLSFLEVKKMHADKS